MSPKVINSEEQLCKIVGIIKGPKTVATLKGGYSLPNEWPDDEFGDKSGEESLVRLAKESLDKRGS